MTTQTTPKTPLIDAIFDSAIVDTLRLSNGEARFRCDDSVRVRTEYLGGYLTGTVTAASDEDGKIKFLCRWENGPARLSQWMDVPIWLSIYELELLPS